MDWFHHLKCGAVCECMHLCFFYKPRSTVDLSCASVHVDQCMLPPLNSIGCVYISLENAFDESASLVHRNICQKKKRVPGCRKVSVSSAELNETSTG